MKTTWNNKIGSRGRLPIAIIVDAAGTPHRFVGESIKEVCHSEVTTSEKAGKWGNTTFRVIHSEASVFVSWRQDFETGRAWPQTSWLEAYGWLKKRASKLNRPAFENLIREEWPDGATRFDRVAAAEREFESPAETGKTWNLTQHEPTPSQSVDGVKNPPADKLAEIRKLLTVEKQLSLQQYKVRCEFIIQAVATFATAGDQVMVGGQLQLMLRLIPFLEASGFVPVASFSIRKSVDDPQPDGGVRKTMVFEHLGFDRLTP